MSQMNRYWISPAGVRIPGIVYGTAWKKEQTAALVEQALRLGFRGLDTAGQPKHYDEAGVGAGMARALPSGLDRQEIFLQSKFTPIDGQDPRRLPYDPKASLSAQVAQSFANSLRNLRTDYLDSLILHSPLPDRKALLEVWRALECIVEAGGARQLGISNLYDPEQLADLYQMARIKPAVVQNRFYAQTGYDREIREFCRRQGMLYQSFWTLTANAALLAHERVQDLARAYRRTPAQIFYRYLTQIGIIPLIGTTSTRHMQEDLAIYEFELLASECEKMRALL
ncbi:MAG: aldo/keto reductase family protein [Methylococcus sp.]